MKTKWYKNLVYYAFSGWILFLVIWLAIATFFPKEPQEMVSGPLVDGTTYKITLPKEARQAILKQAIAEGRCSKDVKDLPPIILRCPEDFPPNVGWTDEKNIYHKGFNEK